MMREQIERGYLSSPFSVLPYDLSQEVQELSDESDCSSIAPPNDENVDVSN